MLGDSAKLTIYGISDVGLVRDHNEDHIHWDGDLGLIILADGMGGHNAGEVASELAVVSIQDALRDVLTPEMYASNNIQYSEAVREAIHYANNEINRHASEHVECHGMGTTIVLTLFHGDTLVSAHVGDSRAYRYRENELSQLTSDHSLVQEMVDNGYISEEEAQNSSSRNLITRALGIGDEVVVDVMEDKAENDDIYLLCSDGLTDLVTNDEISQVLQNHASELSGCDLEAVSKELVSLANERGGKDNISVILICRQQAFSDDKGIEN